MRNCFSILLQSVQLASKTVLMASNDSSAEDSVLRRRETDRESCLRLEFSIYYMAARPSKVLTAERLVFLRNDYEIESGQTIDTASGRKIIAKTTRVSVTNRSIVRCAWV